MLWVQPTAILLSSSNKRLSILVSSMTRCALEMAGMEVEAMHPRFLPVNMKSTLHLKIPFLSLIIHAYMRPPVKPLAGQTLVVARNRLPEGLR